MAQLVFGIGRIAPVIPAEQSFGGNWTAEKLERLRNYLAAYTTIMNRQPFRFSYIDAFAGTGYNTARALKGAAEAPLFPELAELDVQEFVDGSARIALRITPAFQQYVFIEKDPDRCTELEKLKMEFPLLADRIRSVNADANGYLQRICREEDWSNHRAVLFLDPFGMQVSWDTIRAIAQTRSIDVWVLFPLGIAVNRLLTRSGEMVQGWRNRLTDFFGTDAWEQEFYRKSESTDLWGNTETLVYKDANLTAIAEFFNRRLRSVFADVASNSLPLTNSRGQPLFLLCLPSPIQAPKPVRWPSKLRRISSADSKHTMITPDLLDFPRFRHATGPPVLKREPVDFWDVPATIQPNNFIHKSLSNWSFNVAIGCSHGCRFCYVPSAATIKMGALLKRHGIADPDAQWGDYVLLRRWDEKKFLASLVAAQRTPLEQLKPDGNRAIIYCSTTDPYQAIRHPDTSRQRELAAAARHIVRRSLELIRDHSSLRVRILTRSPLARQDFDLFRSFGPRLLFGMSLPTLRNDLAKIYEPRAPAPSQRLTTLQAAHAAGLHLYVAIAPTYPECDAADFRATLEAIGPLNPLTIFHEPINIRAENVQRIAIHARRLGLPLRTDVFATRETWQDYALGALRDMHQAAEDTGLAHCLHLWPDKSLGSLALARRQKNPRAYLRGLEKSWKRVSQWPGAA